MTTTTDLMHLRRLMRVVPIPGDGNCLFGAVLASLRHTTTTTRCHNTLASAGELRVTVAEATRDERRRLELRAGHWGASDDFPTIAAVLQRPLVVFHEDATETAVEVVLPDGTTHLHIPDDDVSHTFNVGGSRRPRRPPVFIRHRDFHFDALVKSH